MGHGFGSVATGILLVWTGGTMPACYEVVEVTEGDGSDTAADSSVAEAFTALQVAAGGENTCAVLSDGALVCWGSNYLGQSAAPAGVFRRVATRNTHSCAISEDSSVVCWGDIVR